MIFMAIIKELLEAAPYIVLGFLLAGVIREFVSRDILNRHLGSKGLLPLTKAVGIGSLLPLCSCGTIPLGIGLYRCGAAAGTTLTFMTSTPVLSPVVIVLAWSLLGPKLAITLFASAIGGAFLLGLVGNILLVRKDDAPNPTNRRTYERICSTGSGNRLWRILRWSFCELGAETSIDLLIGLGIAAVLISLLPMEWIASWLGTQQLSTLIYVIVIGIPTYVCSIPAVPIVQSLLLLGITPGAAIAYMIAGPATNLGELNAIRRSMGFRTVAYYSAVLVALALLAGSLADRVVFPDYRYSAHQLDNGNVVVDECCVPQILAGGALGQITLESVPAWRWPFGVFLAVMLAAGACKRVGEFWIDPCKTCIWRGYGSDGSCGSRCHVRRKHDWLRAALGFFGRARDTSPD